MPVSGDTIRYSNIAANSVNITQTGTNYYWNYDTVVAQSQGRYDYKAASQTPYSFYFTGAGNYGIKIADSLGASTFKFYKVYDFYKKTTAYFETEGIGFTYSGFPLATHYSDPDEIYSLPLTYLRHDSTTYAFTMSLGTNISYSQKGYRINDVDGWGVIKTPHDSVECLRLVSTLIEKDSINYNGFGYSFPNNQRTYKWMAASEHIPVLEVDGTLANNNNFTPTQARYRDSWNALLSSISKQNENKISVQVFPNPAQNFVIIKTNFLETATVELFDVNGKVLRKTNTQQGICVLDVKEFVAQEYFYRIISKQGDMLHSGKVILSR